MRKSGKPDLGATTQSPPFAHEQAKRDCFASLAMTLRAQPGADLTAGPGFRFAQSGLPAAKQSPPRVMGK
jgi:hypothetical protein